MLALGLYGVLFVVVALRVRLSEDPVLVTPVTWSWLHVLYLLILALLGNGEWGQVGFGLLVSFAVVLPVLVTETTLIMPADRDFIRHQVGEACRMLRIGLEQDGSAYLLTTRAGRSRLTFSVVAPRGLLGTMRGQEKSEGDGKIILFHRLLKKKFGHIFPHITIKTG
jgi:hypothetical protein